MKVIDLLNKLANGEEVPEKIRFNGEVYEKEPMYFLYKYLGECCEAKKVEQLNAKVEIIEDTPKEEIQVLSRYSPPKEDKKLPKKIQSCGDNLYSEYIGQWLVHKENYSEYDELLMNKYNELIDYLKSRGE